MTSASALPSGAHPEVGGATIVEEPDTFAPLVRSLRCLVDSYAELVAVLAARNGTVAVVDTLDALTAGVLGDLRRVGALLEESRLAIVEHMAHLGRLRSRAMREQSPSAHRSLRSEETGLNARTARRLALVDLRCPPADCAWLTRATVVACELSTLGPPALWRSLRSVLLEAGIQTDVVSWTSGDGS